MSSSPLPDAQDDVASSQKHSPEQTHPPNPLQATEQQLKARAEGVSIEDYLLPRSITLRLAKSVLPPQTSVQKDAVLAIQKAATVFVSYLSSQANESTLKRTVSPSDVLNALSELEFEGFRPRLERELDMFTEAKAAKRRPRKSEDANTTATGATTEGGAAAAKEAVPESEQAGEKKEVVVRGTKRVKRDGVAGDKGQDQDEDEEDEAEDGDDAVEEEHDEDATEEEEEDEEDEDDGHEDNHEDDIDRVEDLDRGSSRRMVDPDAADSDSDDDGAGNQLRGDLGLG